MKSIIYLFVTVIIINCAFSTDSNYKNIIEKTINLYNDYQSMSYSVEYKFKSMSSNDTMKITADCILIKDRYDDKIKRIYWLSASNGREVFSLIDKSAYIDTAKSRICISTSADHQNSIKGNIADAVIDVYFFNPIQLLNFIDDSTIVTKLETDIINGKQMWKFEFNLPDENGFSGIQENNWIDKDSFLIKRINAKIKYQGEYQYQELKIYNIKFDVYEKSDLEIKFDSLTKIYQVIDIDSFRLANDARKKIIKSGNEAPAFSGYNFQNRTKTDLRKFNANLILLDFWYMACAPCIQAIKGIDKLYNKYKKNEFLVLGINSTDDYKNEKRLNKFLKYNEISYPLLFVDKSVDSLYQVKAYPTFYLIGKDGKVIYSSVGFNESEIDSLEFYIKKHLNLK